MYLHVGNNKTIRKNHIIAILDTDNATRSNLTRKFLTDAERRGDLIAAAEEIPKSFIIYKAKAGFAVCFSPLSVSALEGRMY